MSDILSNSKLSQVDNILKGYGPVNDWPVSAEFERQLREAVFEPHKYEYNLINDPGYKAGKFKIQNMVTALHKNAMLSDMLGDRDALVNEERYFDEPNYGLQCKAVLNIRVRGTILMLKTTSAKSREDFEARIAAYDINRQGAFILDGCDCDRFIVIGVSKEYPHPTYTIVLDHDSPEIEAGRQKYTMLINEYLDLKSKSMII
jgi:hypothetical protein